MTYNDGTDNLYELVDGELFPMPTASGLHALTMVFLFKQFDREIARLGLNWTVMPRNVGVRTTDSKSRIPDLVILTEEQTEAIRNMPSAVLQITQNDCVVLRTTQSFCKNPNSLYNKLA